MHDFEYVMPQLHRSGESSRLAGRRLFMDCIAVEHGLPKRLRMDNGPEFRSKAVVEWALERGVRLEYIQPGKPTQNAFIESFNARLREECLDQELLLSLEDAKQKVEQWRTFYNNFRPHSALGGMPPSRFTAEQQTPSPSPSSSGFFCIRERV